MANHVSKMVDMLNIINFLAVKLVGVCAEELSFDLRKILFPIFGAQLVELSWNEIWVRNEIAN